MDFANLTYACASWAEARSVKRGKTVVVGVGCHNDPKPAGELLSWGSAGSLVSDLKAHEIVEGVRIVDINGNELWRRDREEKPTGFREVTVYTAERIVDDPNERGFLHELSGAHVIDMESAILARTGRLHRIVRVVSDDPSAPLRMASFMLARNGKVDLRAVFWAFRISPLRTAPELMKLKQALRHLKKVNLA